MNTREMLESEAIKAGKEQGHTPTPWHVGMKPGPMVYGKLGEQIADCRGLDESGHNARFICKAVNCHDDLVEALRRLISDHEQGLDFEISWSLAKAILKKAGEA